MDYNKTKKDFYKKLHYERYEDVYSTFNSYISLGKDPKEMLACLKDASLEARGGQTIESMQEEAKMLSRIFADLKKKELLTSNDVKYVEDYIEDYRRLVIDDEKIK